MSEHTSFAGFVREQEERMTPDEREQLDAWRDYYRRKRDGEDPTGVRVQA